MKQLYIGKTKDVYELEDGNFLLQFKDDVTGEMVYLILEQIQLDYRLKGLEEQGLKLTQFFFEILKEKGIPTHYIAADIEAATMTVVPASVFGRRT